MVLLKTCIYLFQFHFISKLSLKPIIRNSWSDVLVILPVLLSSLYNLFLRWLDKNPFHSLTIYCILYWTLLIVAVFIYKTSLILQYNAAIRYWYVLHFRLLYSKLIGGVNAMTKEQFVLVNGYSNKFYGWGGEDDDMYFRWICLLLHINWIWIKLMIRLACK